MVLLACVIAVAFEVHEYCKVPESFTVRTASITVFIVFITFVVVGEMKAPVLGYLCIDPPYVGCQAGILAKGTMNRLYGFAWFSVIGMRDLNIFVYLCSPECCHDLQTRGRDV